MRLGHHLRQPLGGAHHIRRTDGLVGTDQDEILSAEGGRRAGNVARAEDVILHGLEQVGFHQRHVFVRRCVIDGLRTVLAKDLLQPAGVLNVPDLGMEGDVRKMGAKLSINFVKRGLGMVETDQRGRLQAGDLAA